MSPELLELLELRLKDVARTLARKLDNFENVGLTVGAMRRACIARLDCQSDLSASITKLNPRSRLFLIREAPQTLFPKLFRAWSISHLVFEKDTDAYGRDRDAQVMRIAKDAGVEVIVRVGRTLYDPDRLVQENGGKPTMSIAQVTRVGDPSAFLRGGQRPDSC